MDPRAPSGWQIERTLAAWHAAQQSLQDDTDLPADEAAIVTAISADDPAAIPPAELIGRMIDALSWADRRLDEATALQRELAARKQRYQQRVDTLRATLTDLMTTLNQTTARGRYQSATIRPVPPSSVITDETALPDEYIRITRTPDRRLILNDLKQGVVIEGATLSNAGQTLQLRNL